MEIMRKARLLVEVDEGQVTQSIPAWARITNHAKNSENETRRDVVYIRIIEADITEECMRKALNYAKLKFVVFKEKKGIN